MRRTNIICPTWSWSAMRDGRHPVAIEGEAFETAGVNSRAELAHLELDWQRRRREQALDEGATLIDPESVWFSADTELGRDCTIEPHVVFGPGVTIADGATIHAFCHIEGATIASGCEVGPFARLRPGRGARRGRQGRQFRRDEEGDARRGRQGQSSELYRRRRASARRPTSARARSPAITTASSSIAPRSARARSSARTARWSRRSSIGAGAIVGAGSVITKNVEADEPGGRARRAARAGRLGQEIPRASGSEKGQSNNVRDCRDCRARSGRGAAVRRAAAARISRL